jgi:hypothetical protein
VVSGDNPNPMQDIDRPLSDYSLDEFSPLDCNASTCSPRRFDQSLKELST